MNEEEASQGTSSSKRRVDAFHFQPNTSGSIFRQRQSCQQVFLRANRQHHLNPSCPLNNAPRTKSRPAFSTLIFRCRLFFCVRRRCRHGSNRTSTDGTIICAATTDDGNRSSTATCCSHCGLTFVRHCPRQMFFGHHMLEDVPYCSSLLSS